LLPPCELLRIN